MSYREWFPTILAEVNLSVLHSDLADAGFSNIEGISNDLDANSRVGVDFPDGSPPSAGDIIVIQGIVDGHDATDYDGIFVADAKQDIRDQIGPLTPTSTPRQAFIIAITRHIRDAYSDVDTIDTVGQAVAYVDSLADFQEFSAGEQTFLKRLMSSLTNVVVAEFS